MFVFAVVALLTFAAASVHLLMRQQRPAFGTAGRLCRYGDDRRHMGEHQFLSVGRAPPISTAFAGQPV
jgi:hypothetical protein